MGGTSAESDHDYVDDTITQKFLHFHRYLTESLATQHLKGTLPSK